MEYLIGKKRGCSVNMEEQLRCNKEHLSEMKKRHKEATEKLNFLSKFALGDAPDRLTGPIIGWQYQQVQYFARDIEELTLGVRELKNQIKKEKKVK